MFALFSLQLQNTSVS